MIVTRLAAVIALDAKMSVQNVYPEELPAGFKKMFPAVERLVLVTFGGKRIALSKQCLAVPIGSLHEFLLEI